MKSSASSCSVGAQCVRYSSRDKVTTAGVGTGVGVCVGAIAGIGVGTGVCAGAMVGVGVGPGVTPGCAVTAGVGTAPADGVGLDPPEHPVRSMARRIAPAHTKPSAMDFDIIILLGARFSATIASTLAFRMTRGKVCEYLMRGVLFDLPVRFDRTLPPPSSGVDYVAIDEA